MKRPGIPAVPPTQQPELASFLGALKESVELTVGQRGITTANPELTPLASTASTAQIIAAINKIINRLS